MKKDIAEFITRCQNVQQVNVEHQKSGGLLQEIQIPIWKWEDINMDFVVIYVKLKVHLILYGWLRID